MNDIVDNGASLVGEVIDGRYRIDALHAVGGMSVVYRATHLLLARPVALKVVSPSILALPGSAARFLREARAATQLKNDHIVQVFDVGVLDSGAPFLVMEWLEGRDLAQVLQLTGPMPLATAVDYIIQTCESLAEVHGRGIIHRDLKPSNLFVTTGPDGLARIKLLDFGVSKVAICGGGSRITQSGTAIGSPSYMSPEQMGEAEGADERTDVWGLGVVLYELLAGFVPFAGTTLTDILAAILLHPLAPVTAVRKDISPGLDEVLAKCLKPEPEERFQSVAELAEALAPYGPPGSIERAELIARLSTAAKLNPLNPNVAASDDDLIHHVHSKSDPPRAPQPAQPHSHESVTPFVKSAEHLELVNETDSGETVRDVRPKKKLRGAMVAALVLVAIGVGIPAGLGRFAKNAVSERLFGADPTAAASAAIASPKDPPPPPPPPPTAVVIESASATPSAAPVVRWADVPPDASSVTLAATTMTTTTPAPVVLPPRTAHHVSHSREPWPDLKALAREPSRPAPPSSETASAAAPTNDTKPAGPDELFQERNEMGSRHSCFVRPSSCSARVRG